uniref:Uncharacterized protein n=1 Tax=Brassica oleracea TaxID=3712 RepID=A0A3P6DCT9_BRAOL|nr:unnamed protein product [Brassica oleracea]
MTEACVWLGCGRSSLSDSDLEFFFLRSGLQQVQTLTYKREE